MIICFRNMLEDTQGLEDKASIKISLSTDSSVFILYKIVLYFTFSFLRKERDLSKEAKKKFRNSSSVLSWGPQAWNALKHTNLIRIRICALPLKSTKYSSWSFKYKIPGSYLSSLLWMEFWFFLIIWEGADFSWIWKFHDLSFPWTLTFQNGHKTLVWIMKRTQD